MEDLRLERRPEARAFSVETLLQQVRDGKIRIPDFQRPLRWRANHVLDLFDSVYRGFPVGDLLLFKRAAEAGAIHVGPLHVHAPAVADAYWVVDGQQRITALTGALLHPESRPSGDIYAVWFDLEEERFARRYLQPAAHWIPLSVVADSFALLTWLNAWPFRAQRPDLVQRAIALGKALREYQIPAYIVEGASDEVLRLIFKRVNASGVAMLETEVFTALFSGGAAQSVEAACARLQTTTGFGEISPDGFLRCLKAVEGFNAEKELGERQIRSLDPVAVEHTERALLRALRTDATHAYALVDPDEAASVERLLATVPVTLPLALPSAMTDWEPPEGKTGQLWALALAHFGSRDPETGEVLSGDEIRSLLERASIGEVFMDLRGDRDGPAAHRSLVSNSQKLAKLRIAPRAILESHGLDQEAAIALAGRDFRTFSERRATILDRWLGRFFAGRLGGDDGDRPSIAELIHRADSAVAVT